MSHYCHVVNIYKQTMEKLVTIILRNTEKLSKRKTQVKTYLHLTNYPNT